jgi:hypothetical protein
MCAYLQGVVDASRFRVKKVFQHLHSHRMRLPLLLRVVVVMDPWCRVDLEEDAAALLQ